MKQLLVAGAALAAFGLTGANAAQTVVDFSGLGPAGTQINALPGGVTVSVVSPGNPDQAILFDTNNPTGGDTDLASDFAPVGSTSEADETEDLGFVLIIAEDLVLQDGTDIVADPDDKAAGGTFVFDFSLPTTFEAITLADTKPGVLFEGFEVGNNTGIADFSFTYMGDLDNDGSLNFFDDLTFAGWTNLASLEITLPDSGAIDNFTYTAVPVPGALPLMMGGAALLTAAGRRRRQR
ncbi:MAG: hypothetical protein AAFR65_05185 [Pseudomonadota bacterium]